MGTLRKYRLKNSGCNIFFETGTGLGSSLRHAFENGNFTRLYSTEIHNQTAIRAQNIFRKIESIEILNSDSFTALSKILPTLDKDDNVLFFLDAHFPGEVSSEFEGYSNNIPSEKTLPLINELELISKLRPKSKDIIIIDDLKLYEDGPYANGNISNDFANIPAEMRSLHFVNSLFNGRTILKDYKDEGYLIIKPNNSLFELKELSQFYRFKRNMKKHMRNLIGQK